jgi:hypothetical protein
MDIQVSKLLDAIDSYSDFMEAQRPLLQWMVTNSVSPDKVVLTAAEIYQAKAKCDSERAFSVAKCLVNIISDALLSEIPKVFSGLEKLRSMMDPRRSSATSSSSYNAGEYELLRLSGIDTEIYHYPRPILLNKVINILIYNRFLVFNSSAAMGKTSLIAILVNTYKRFNYLHFPTKGKALKNPIKFLKSKLGIDLENETVRDGLYDVKQTYVIIVDDAQKLYEHKGFWSMLIKDGEAWLPKNLKFIFSTTHLLQLDLTSPADFGYLPKIERVDFVLNEKESKEILSSPLGLKPERRFARLIDMIVAYCGGVFGLLKIVSYNINMFKHKESDVKESDLIQVFYSKAITENMSRCFGAVHEITMTQNLVLFLRKLFFSNIMATISSSGISDPKDKIVVNEMIKSGVLWEDAHGIINFTSEMAKKYYYKLF